MANQDEQLSVMQQLDNAMNDITAYLNGNDPKSTLHANWIYLQIYATYGLRLPGDAGALESALRLTASQAAGYTWFNSMWGAYGTLRNASKYFFSEVFDKMTSLGEGLKSYSTEVAGQDSTFTLISSLVKPTDGSDPDPAAALDILSDLKSAAQNNAALAGELKSNLAAYKADLGKAQGQMAKVKKDVEADDSVSEEAIKKLAGGKDLMGSLEQLTYMLSKDKAAYEHDVIVSSTTVTYAWVGFPLVPIGLIAAATVAGIFGKKAVNIKDTIDKLEGQIKIAKHELTVALNTQNTVKLAENSLNNVINHTNVAIEKTTQIENSWKDVVTALTYISGKVSSSIKMEDGEEKLASTNAIVSFMKKAQERWTAFQPSINSMVENAYIKVEEKDFSLGDFANQVVAEAAKLEVA